MNKSGIPQDRVCIRSRMPGDRGDAEGVDAELPFKILVLGDLYGQESDVPLEERHPVDVRRETLDGVMKGMEPKLHLQVPNHLADDGSSLQVALSFAKQADFSPDGVSRQVPELTRLLELREAYGLLKLPKPDKAAFHARLCQLVPEAGLRRRMLSEVGLSPNLFEKRSKAECS